MFVKHFWKRFEDAREFTRILHHWGFRFTLGGSQVTDLLQNVSTGVRVGKNVGSVFCTRWAGFNKTYMPPYLFVVRIGNAYIFRNLKAFLGRFEAGDRSVCLAANLLAAELNLSDRYWLEAVKHADVTHELACFQSLGCYHRVLWRRNFIEVQKHLWEIIIWRIRFIHGNFWVFPPQVEDVVIINK